MNPIAVFHNDGGSHRLARFLKKEFRHVFCAIPAGDYWLTIDGRAGLPHLQVVAGTEYDLAEFYRGEGYSVVEVTTLRTPPNMPFILSNCVGVVKVVLSIRAPFVVTPYQLFKHLRGQNG